MAGLYARRAFTSGGVDYPPLAPIPPGAIPDEDLDILRQRKFVDEKHEPAVTQAQFQAVLDRLDALEAEMTTPTTTTRRRQ